MGSISPADWGSRGVRSGGRTDEGVRETGDEVPLRHHGGKKKEKGLEGKVKDCCSGIKSKPLHLPSSPETEAAARLEERAGENATGNESETKQGFRTTEATQLLGPAHLSLIKNQCSWYTTVYEPIQSPIRGVSCSAPPLNLDCMLTCLLGS